MTEKGPEAGANLFKFLKKKNVLLDIVDISPSIHIILYNLEVP